MTITYDDERHDLTLEARELGDDDDDEPQSGDVGDAGHVMAGVEQTAGHRRAHGADADKTDFA